MLLAVCLLAVALSLVPAAAAWSLAALRNRRAAVARALLVLAFSAGVRVILAATELASERNRLMAVVVGGEEWREGKEVRGGEGRKEKKKGGKGRREKKGS